MEGLLEEQLSEEFAQWQIHCDSPEMNFTSSPLEVTNCEAYRNIVSMGEVILPLLSKYFQLKTDDLNRIYGLINLVNEIVDVDFDIPDDMTGDVSRIQEYTFNWILDNYSGGQD